jgi:hypothetical protein
MIALSEDTFLKYKKHLDGFVFWRKDSDGTILVKQVCPDRSTKQLLMSFKEYGSRR